MRKLLREFLHELLLGLDFAFEIELRFEAELDFEGEMCLEPVRLFVCLRAEFGALLLIER